MAMLVYIVNILAFTLTVIIFARVIVSWIMVGGSGNNQIVAFVYRISEPILAPIRRVLPRTGAIDLSPMVALLIIYAVRELVSRLV